MSKFFSIVVAATQAHGIGFQGKLPWPRLLADMKHFAKTTTTIAVSTEPGAALAPTKRNAVIMGRVTFDSLPTKFKPLGGRFNVVVSRTLKPGLHNVAPISTPSGEADPSTSSSEETKEGAEFYVSPSFEAALAAVQGDGELAAIVDAVFVIGGAEIYQAAIGHPRCGQVLLTRVFQEFPCDRFFPFETLVPGMFTLDIVGEVLMEGAVAFQMQTWKRHRDEKTTRSFSTSPKTSKHEEQNYLDLVREVIDKGTQVIDRTLVGTRFLFGRDLRFSLRDGKLPLYNTKRVPLGSMLSELLWLLRGDTCSIRLNNAGCKIWNENGSRAFLDKCGLHANRIGDLGPIYGMSHACVSP